MTFLFALQTVLEILAVSFVIWGLFNEKKLVRFEQRLACTIRRKALKVIRNNGNCHKHCA